MFELTWQAKAVDQGMFEYYGFDGLLFSKPLTHCLFRKPCCWKRLIHCPLLWTYLFLKERINGHSRDCVIEGILTVRFLRNVYSFLIN